MTKNGYLVFNNSKIEHKKSNNRNLLYTKIPNEFIRCNIENTYGVNKILLPLYVTINKNRSASDESRFSFRELLTDMHYNCEHGKKKIFFEIERCLCFLRDNNFIECDLPEKILYDTEIIIKIIPQIFDNKYAYTSMIPKEYEEIIKLRSEDTSTENIIQLYLYFKSYIGNRNKNNNKIEACFKSLENIANELCISYTTINKCINYLTTENKQLNYKPLLIKQGSKENGTIPNIYVLNKEGYEKEIELAIKWLKSCKNIRN